jgi:hypothetical protein
MHHKQHTFHNQIVYPNFESDILGEVFENGEHLWVKEAVKHANKIGYQRIDVSCAATIPSSRTGKQTNDIFFNATQVITPTHTCAELGMIGQ